MSDGKDIRFIEPTNYVIQPHQKKGMVGLLMQGFPDVIRTEAQANAVLIFVVILCAAMSMGVVLSSDSPRGLSQSEIEVYGDD